MAAVGKRLPSTATSSLAILAISLAAGCGGGGADEHPYTVRASTTMTAASPVLTKAQFIEQVNEACRRGWRDDAEQFARYSNTLEPGLTLGARYARSVRKSLLIGFDFHIFDVIRIVGSPPGDEQRIERFIGPFQRAVELGELGRWQAQTPAQVAAHFAAFNRGARRYGLDDCLINEAHLRGIRIRVSR